MTKPILYLMLLVGGALAAGTGVITYGELRQAPRTAATMAPAGPAESDVAASEAPPANADRPVTAEESLAVPQPAPAAPAGPVPSEPAEPEREIAALQPAGPQAEEETPQAPPAAAKSPAPDPQTGASEPGEPGWAEPSETAAAEAVAPPPGEPQRSDAPSSAPGGDPPSSAPLPTESAALQPREEPAPPPAPSPAEAEPAEPAPGMPSFDIVRVEPTGEAVIAGNAPGGAKVEILSNGEVVAETSADEGGNWVALPERPLGPGGHDLTIRAVSPEGEETQSEQHVAVAVPHEPGEEVVAVLAEPDKPSAILAGPGREPPVASSEPPRKLEPMATATGIGGARGAAAAGAPPLSVDAVEAEGRTMFVAGAGDPGALVRVYVDGELVGEAEAGAGGRWLVEATKALEEGELTVRADQLKAGTAKVEARAEVPFVRRLDMAALVPAARAGVGAGDSAEGGALPEPGAVIIRRGDNLWTISRRTYGRGIRYTTIYNANQDQIRDPHWIYPGQVFMLPTRDRAWAEE